MDAISLLHYLAAALLATVLATHIIPAFLLG